MGISKHRHNQGTGMSTNTIQVYGLNDVLRRMVAKLPPDPKKVKSSPKIKLNVLLTDEQVLECRSRYEFEGWTKDRLLLEYSKYGVTQNYLYSLLTYATRSRLIPKKPK